jgi:hypothetical protein
MKRTKQKARAANWKFLLFIAILIVVLNGIGFFIVFRRPTTRARADSIPHYLATIGMARPLPQTLDPEKFSNRDVAAAYQSAKEIPEILAQQPCYCHCDRSRGHRSLLDCFSSQHGSDCDICVKEALFALQEHRKGRSPEQIRMEIIQGDWRTIQFQD